MDIIRYFRTRLWYRIELIIGKGGTPMFYALAIVLVFTILMLLGIRYLLIWILPEASMPAEDLSSNFYHLLMEVTDAGNMGNFLNDTIWLKITAIFAGMCGIVIFSLLVAIITTAVDKMLYTFSQGTTNVYEKDHYLIIGYNSRLTDILKEFAIASKYERHTVVILSEMPKEELDLKIELVIQNNNNLRIITRRGEITSPKMLEKVSVDTARSIIVLSSCESYYPDVEKEDSDTNVIKICYALYIAINKGHKIMVIPELYNQSNREIVKTMLKDSVLQVDANTFLSRLLVQTSLFNGLVSVYEELFSFEGSEIYLVENKFGRVKFGDMTPRLLDGIVIGYKCPEQGLILNPPVDTVIEKDFRLVMIISDISNNKLLAEPLKESKPLNFATIESKPKIASILVIGWNSETDNIITEYDKYIVEKSSFKLVLTRSCAPSENVLSKLKNKIQSNLQIDLTDVLDEDYLAGLNIASYDMMVVLTSTVHVTNSKAVDSANIKLLLMVQKQLQQVEKRPLIVAEVFDSSNLELFDHMGLSDYLLSNRFISIFLTQLSKQPELIEIYDRLLSTDGAEIYIKPISNYLGDSVGKHTFVDLIYLGQRCNEVIIGYKQMLDTPNENGKNYEVVINPNKQKEFYLTQNDSLVVISSVTMCVK